MSEPTERQLLWVVFAILAVHALLLAALIAIALRVTVISLTLPAKQPAKTSSSQAGSNAHAAATLAPAVEPVSCAAAANRSNPFRGLDPAALGLLVETTPAGGLVTVALSRTAARRERRRHARSAKYPRSRDWAPHDVRCQVAYCPCNRHGRCTLPSQIDIGPDGKCRKADEFKTHAATSAPVSGD